MPRCSAPRPCSAQPRSWCRSPGSRLNVRLAARTLPVESQVDVDARRHDRGAARPARSAVARHGRRRRRRRARGPRGRVELAGLPGLARGRGLRHDRPHPGLRRVVLCVHAADARPAALVRAWRRWAWPRRAPARCTCSAANWRSRRSARGSPAARAAISGSWRRRSSCCWRLAPGSTGRTRCSRPPASSAAPATLTCTRGCRLRSPRWRPRSSAPRVPWPTRSRAGRRWPPRPSASTRVVVLAGQLYAGAIQRFVVTPNEQVREAPYIQHNIDATRRAFALDTIAAAAAHRRRRADARRHRQATARRSTTCGCGITSRCSRRSGRSRRSAPTTTSRRWTTTATRSTASCAR